MSLVSGLMALYRPYLLQGAIQLQDNSDGNGPFVAYWNEQIIGVTQAEGEARALAFDDLILTQTTPYRVEATHNAIGAQGVVVNVELVQGGEVIATSQATIVGNTAHELFIVPSGVYVVRFSIAEPFIAGELEATF